MWLSLAETARTDWPGVDTKGGDGQLVSQQWQSGKGDRPQLVIKWIQSPGCGCTTKGRPPLLSILNVKSSASVRWRKKERTWITGRYWPLTAAARIEAIAKQKRPKIELQCDCETKWMRALKKWGWLRLTSPRGYNIIGCLDLQDFGTKKYCKKSGAMMLLYKTPASFWKMAEGGAGQNALIKI